MKQMERIKSLSLLLSLLALACQDADNSGSQTGTETNWLKVCQSDADCGELSCNCGVCTLDCRADADCDAFKGVCTTGQALTEQCGGPRAGGLCLEPGSNAVDAGDDSDPSTGTDDTTTQASNVTDSGPNSSQSDPTELPTDDTTSNPSTSTFDSGSGAPTETETTEPPDADAGSETEPIDAGGQLCEGLRPEVEGCCYQADDCAAGEHCYDADCALPAAGRCATPPTGNCFADTDCAEGERCENGSLAPCGTLGPDQLGTCVADCDFDSCHPERCDEAGEPCCDPLPGDGPNYCNATLTCLDGVCSEQETTTPEEQARQSCEATGGTWEYEDCGHYVCGVPNDCDAIIPGCNCGAGRTFDTLGCAAEAQCADGAPSFECGEQSCGAITDQYCEQFTGGPGIVTYTCRDVPAECTRVTCSCLIPDEGLSYTCAAGSAGELILQPPPAP